MTDAAVCGSASPGVCTNAIFYAQRAMGSDGNARACVETVLEERNRLMGLSAVIRDEPDKDVRDIPTVDFLAEGDRAELAIEHTRIESYPQQLQDSRRIMDLLGPLEAQLQEVLPDGWFHLVVPPGAADGIKEGERAREILTDWVLRVAPNLESGRSRSRGGHYCAAEPPDIPLPATLYRWEPASNRRLTIGRDTPEGLEARRRERILVAVQSKCPKLEGWRGQQRTTVLVLEDTDLALSNLPAVEAAVRDVLSEAEEPAPDEVWWVDAWSGSYLAERLNT